jgi:hypothetical protein
VASKSKKKKKGQRGSKTSNAPTRVIDVRQAMTQHLHDAAFVRLEQLLSSEARSAHMALAADVFELGAKTAESLAFHPKDPNALLTRIDSILERLGINDSSASSDSDRVAVILDSAKRLRCLFGGELIADPKLLPRMCDQAVTKAELRARLPNELADETRFVAEALKHVEEGRDEEATSILKPIGYRSVMAPWRLLIRGMIHFYAGRTDEALETWKRLPEDRLPHAMARTILGTVDLALPGQAKVDQRQLTGLIKNKQPDLQVARNDLRELFEEASFVEVLQTINFWKKEGWISPATFNVLNDTVYSAILTVTSPDQTDLILGKLRPPIWDPKLELPRALEHFFSSDPADPQTHAEIDQFIESTQSNPNLSDSDRTAIKAAVNAHVAFSLGMLLKCFNDERIQDADEDSDIVKAFQGIGKCWLNRILNAVEACPQWDAPLRHPRLESISPILLSSELAGEIHDTRLKARPDDVGVIFDAAEFFLQSDPLRARQLVRQLTQIAPRDERTTRLAWKHGTDSFIAALQRGGVKEAEQSLDLLSSHAPPDQPEGVLEMYRAIWQFAQTPDTDFELYLAKNDELKVPRFASLLLLETIAARCGLPAKLRKKFRDMRKPLSKSPSLQTVACGCEMAGRMLADESLDFPGRVGMKKELITTTKRALTQSSEDVFDLQTANTIGIFVVHADDSVLRRQFLRATRDHFRWHIVSLVKALEANLVLASPILSDVVDADANAPGGLPAELRPIAMRLCEASERQHQEEMYSDDFYDEDEMDFDEVDMEELMESIPPEMLLAYLQDREVFEAQLRKMVPRQVADALLNTIQKRLLG